MTRKIVPGEILPAPGEIVLNQGRDSVTVMVANTGDRPIQVGSHYHFAETNPALRFDRAALDAALASDKYVVEGVAGTLAGTAARDKAQRLAVSVVDQLLAKLYRKRENACSRYAFAQAGETLPQTYRKEKKRDA